MQSAKEKKQKVQSLQVLPPRLDSHCFQQNIIHKTKPHNQKNKIKGNSGKMKGLECFQ